MSPCYIKSFEIIEQVGKVAYRLALRLRLSRVYNFFHVSMLKEYHQGPTLHEIDFNNIEVNDNMSHIERPVQILDREIKTLWNKDIPLVKLQWNHYNVEEDFWALESVIREKFSKFFNTS